MAAGIKQERKPRKTRKKAAQDDQRCFFYYLDLRFSQ